jgi:GT2 family glycosyltransferase
VDIVIPAYGNLDITARAFLGCVLNAPKGAQITLVDNGSGETLTPLRPIVESLGHRFLKIEVNVGPYGAVNAGLACGNSDVVAIVCNDVVPLPYSLERMRSGLDRYPIVGAVELQTAPYCTDDLILEAEDKGLYDAEVFEPGVFFSCFVTSRSVFSKVGLFDSRFKLTFGDTDWEQRASDLGYAYVQARHAPVFHGSSVTRKRLGLDADMRVDVADHKTFLDKWQHRTDVLAKHPLENLDFKRAFVKNEWSYRGEK